MVINSNLNKFQKGVLKTLKGLKNTCGPEFIHCLTPLGTELLLELNLNQLDNLSSKP